jgi:hypothetical protein
MDGTTGAVVMIDRVYDVWITDVAEIVRDTYPDRDAITDGTVREILDGDVWTSRAFDETYNAIVGLLQNTATDDDMAARVRDVMHRVYDTSTGDDDDDDDDDDA